MSPQRWSSRARARGLSRAWFLAWRSLATDGQHYESMRRGHRKACQRNRGTLGHRRKTHRLPFAMLWVAIRGRWSVETTCCRIRRKTLAISNKTIGMVCEAVRSCVWLRQPGAEVQSWLPGGWLLGGSCGDDGGPRLRAHGTRHKRVPYPVPHSYALSPQIVRKHGARTAWNPSAPIQGLPDASTAPKIQQSQSLYAVAMLCDRVLDGRME
ncbi:hypothetical protein IG631_19703 [Alternaria alternata]|nr:hypothetical protein IG631_19703 [Alternaria alternata]